MKPFDTIAGSSLGGISDREICCEILRVAAQYENQGDLLWDLAETADEDIDVDAYTDGLNTLCDEYGLLPPYCALIWEDNELRVTPCVESALEDCPRGDELPDGPPSDGDYFCVVSDHGNVTLYNGDAGEWLEVWGVV